MELLLLGSLRYLGRGWTFDDCEESTAIDKDVYRTFFRVFLEFRSTFLYKKWVLTPVNLPEAISNMKEFSVAGFPGCVDIVTDKCKHNLKNNHLGAKNSLTTRTFDLTCNGVRKVVSEWEGDLGCLDYKGVPVEVPNALARLSANLDPRNFDSSGLGPGSDVMAEIRSLVRSKVAANAASCCIDDRAIMMGITNGVDRLQSVRYLLLNVFRWLLVNHFAILID